MAQTGYTPILLYSSTTAAQAPAAGNLTNSTFGSELAINITDGKLFYKDNTNAVQVIAWKTTPTTAGGTGLTSYTAGDLPYYATGTTLSKLSIGSNGQVLTSTGTAPQWTTLSGVAVTTFSAGTTGFTPSVATSGAVTLAGTLITSNGGTGLSSYSQGDLLYYNTGTTLTALAKNTSATRYLSNTGANNNPAWAQIDLSNGVTGTLPVGNGGTGLTTLATGYIPFGNGTGAFNSSANLSFATSILTISTTSATSTARTSYTNTASTHEFGILPATYGGYGVLTAGSAYVYCGNNQALQFAVDNNYIAFGTGTGAPERMRITSAGDINVVTGNVVISTSGKGIDFSATAGTGTSELLADYEEGTFTPAIYTGITSPTYTEQLGRYTKIGNMVYLQIRIALSGGTGAGTQLGINGFPYASNANTPNGNGFNGYNDLSATAIYWYVPQSSSTNILGYFPGGTNATTTGSMTGKSVNVNVVYQV